MVRGRPALKRRSLPLVLAGTLAIQGCAGVRYPAAVPTKGQDAETAERDERECREQAVDAVEASPQAIGLKRMILAGLGGAVVGAVFAIGSSPGWGGYSTDHPEAAAFAMGGGAGLGFVIGSVVGAFKGAKEASGAMRARQQAFARCMTERGYRTE